MIVLHQIQLCCDKYSYSCNGYRIHLSVCLTNGVVVVTATVRLQAASLHQANVDWMSCTSGCYISSATSSLHSKFLHCCLKELFNCQTRDDGNIWAGVGPSMSSSWEQDFVDWTVPRGGGDRSVGSGRCNMFLFFVLVAKLLTHRRIWVCRAPPPPLLQTFYPYLPSPLSDQRFIWRHQPCSGEYIPCAFAVPFVKISPARWRRYTCTVF